MKTRAAILVESRKPLVVDEIELPPVGAGQVLVKILYTTICGAQINEIDAVKGVDKFLPHLLGHEASGFVEDVGWGVSHVKPGDPVVLHWRQGVGEDARPKPYWRFYEFQDVNAGCVTTFQEHAVVSANRVTRIPYDYDMKVAPLLGCALTTALGVVENDAKIDDGDSVLVFGAGGVGLPIVKFAALTGAVVSIVETNEAKLQMAREYGALIVERLHPKALFDKVIETTGKEANSRRGFEITRDDGIFVGVGVPEQTEPGEELDYIHCDRYPTLLGKHYKYKGRWIIQSHGGSSRPAIDIPRIIAMQQAGHISFDRQITHEYSLGQINDAIAMMRSGAAGRIAIKMDVDHGR